MIEANKQLKIPNRADFNRARRLGFLRSPYLILGGLSYLLVLLMVALYLNKDPRFESNMALVLPGSGLSSSFQIGEISQANTCLLYTSPSPRD